MNKKKLFLFFFGKNEEELPSFQKNRVDIFLQKSGLRSELKCFGGYKTNKRENILTIPSYK
ncbi:MAG: hypothetical protein ACTHKY_19620 [Ginsengibacter sp.]